jgi:hypothetical protein
LTKFCDYAGCANGVGLFPDRSKILAVHLSVSLNAYVANVLAESVGRAG